MTKNFLGKDTDKAADMLYAGTEVREAGYVMLKPHCHAFFELFYVESGECRFFIENNMYDIHAGDFMLIPPGVFHYTRYLSEPCKRSIVQFGGGYAEGEVAELMPQGREFFGAVRIFQTPDEYRERINATLAFMVNEKKIADSRSYLMARALFYELLLLCSRECMFLQQMPERIHTTDRPIVLAAQFISKRFAERIGAAEIAAAAGYSPNYLSKKFRASVGLGIHEYLTFIRLQKAALELVTTDDSITEIAFRCGFSDSNYFKDAFKRKYGVTPREYRKS